MRFFVSILFLAFPVALAIECFTGFTYIRGVSVGTSKQRCSSDSDYCYNVTADLTSLNLISKSGCSSLMCRFNHNKCIEKSFLGKSGRFCCCNTGDLCNSKATGQTTLEKFSDKMHDFARIFG
ncbi:unnamed protein product, partial [Mesorhabditis belari]|uniref:Uncharacterized protein n=1 Tax=Mesorhabditis belari TaxID=2138241 RepID=A0AAF3FD32_9BILA